MFQSNMNVILLMQCTLQALGQERDPSSSLSPLCVCISCYAIPAPTNYCAEKTQQPLLVANTSADQDLMSELGLIYKY